MSTIFYFLCLYAVPWISPVFIVGVGWALWFKSWKKGLGFSATCFICTFLLWLFFYFASGWRIQGLSIDEVSDDKLSWVEALLSLPLSTWFTVILSGIIFTITYRLWQKRLTPILTLTCFLSGFVGVLAFKMSAALSSLWMADSRRILDKEGWASYLFSSFFN